MLCHRFPNQLRHRRVLICVAVFASAVAVAAPTRSFNLRSQVEAAEVIVVGRVGFVHQVGAGQVEIGGRSFPAALFEAEARVDRVLKGTEVHQRVIIRFSIPVSPGGGIGYTGVAASSYRMLFLKRAADHFEFANPFYPSLPATSQSALPPYVDPLGAVVFGLGQVIGAARASEMEKLEAIYRLETESSSAVTEILRGQLAASNPRIRAEATSALLQQNYVGALPVARDLLMDPPSSIPDYMLTNLASAIGRGIKDERAVPILRTLLGAPEVEARRAVALALRNTGSRDAIPALTLALDDSDGEVRYYGVIGLAEITGENEWRPLMEEFRTHESRYLSHWRQWASDNRR
jgi:hypothetical protein